LQSVAAQQVRPDQDLFATHKGSLYRLHLPVKREIDKLHIFFDSLSGG